MYWIDAQGLVTLGERWSEDRTAGSLFLKAPELRGPILIERDMTFGARIPGVGA